MDMEPEIDVTLTTPRGSAVSLPGLTRAQADAVEAAIAGDTPRVVEGAKGDPCDTCNGRGGWTEQVQTKGKRGSVVTTERWVNCRPCGGMGKQRR